MKDGDLSRNGLLAELEKLRRRVGELESGRAAPSKTEMEFEIDVAERKRSEKKQRFALCAVDNNADAAFWIRSDGLYTYVNDAACRSLGYAREELLGLSVQDIDPDYTRERWDEHWRKTKERGSSVIETQHKRKDGRVFPVEVRMTFVEFEGQEYHCAFAVDITERKRTEERLRLTQFAVDHMADGAFWTREEDGSFFYVNDAACRDLGYSRDEFSTMTVFDIDPLFTINDRVAANRELRKTKSRIFETAHKAKNGRVYPVEIRADWMEFGGKEYICSFARDITERKMAEEALRQANLVIENSPVVVFRRKATQGWPVATVSHNVIQFGFTSEELLSGEILFASIIHPDDLARVMREVDEYAAMGADVFQQEYRIVTKGGDVRWVDDRSAVERDANGRIVFYQGIVIDITERKQVEVALRESKEHYKNFFENSLVGLFRSRISDGLLLEINSKAAEQQGLPVEEIVGKVRTADMYRNPDQRKELVSRLRQDGEVHDFEADLTLHDGRDVTFSISVRAYPDKDYMEGAVIDITDRKRAEEELRRNETFLEAIWRTSPVGMAVGRDRVFVWANQAWADMHGYSDPREIVGESTGVSYASEEEFERTGRVFYETLKTQHVAETDVHCKRKDGSLFRGHLWLTLVDPDNPDEGVIGAIIDITERERAEKALKESEQRYRTLFEESIDGVYSVSREGEILDANASFCNIFGYTKDEMIGKYTRELYADPADRPRLQNEIEKSGFVKDYAVKFIRKDGKELDCQVTSSVYLGSDGRIAGYRGIVRDVTEQQLLQRQLLQAQKMEAVGTLAGGIAHDVNNLLQAVLGYSDLLLMNTGQSDPDRKKLEIIQHAARDGAELVSRILTFSRKGEPEARPIDLNEEILGTEKLLRRTLPRMVEIELILAKDIWIIDADPAQLEQVIVNLGVNAQHAMPNGGTLLIETHNVSLSDEYLRTHLGARKGKYVRLTVSDTGIGIEPEVLDRIFEPFFTTKANGMGTGLGLAMVHGIVAQHRGYIRCYSEPGKGTSFKIYFPVSRSEAASHHSLTREMPAFGTETILLVDDDDRIRDMGKQMMEMGGYKVLIAKNGEEAIAVYSSNKKDIALIILDLIMPGMGGSRCLAELLRMDPNIKVLVASGCSSNGLTQGEKGAGARGFVTKPYDSKEILAAIRKVLDEGQL